ncbi:MAG: dihydroorotase [Cytophagales bacterium]|nr:dihydroorotase [Cytophagales bacterium]
MQSILILNANIVNENRILKSDVYIKGEFIERIDHNLSHLAADKVIDAKGKYLLPGVIDDQVHFREPGITHKADIFTESRAAIAGGITTFMEMPNTVPNALTQSLLQDKYLIAEKTALANYSFYMGVSNDNFDEVMKTDPKNICGIKIFMGASTGNMLVDNEQTLERVFANAGMLIATHCEDEATIKANMALYREQYGEEVPVKFHPLIRSTEACYKSSSFAMGLAKKHGTKLHILHLSTAKEIDLFDNSMPLKDKKITGEACIHHLWFNDSDYEEKQSLIKWNPAVKTAEDRNAVFNAVLSDHLDVIATDHAPHTLEEKQNTSYFKTPSGGPLVQHSLVAMLEFYHQGKISLEKIVEKMAHNPAILFEIEKRGYVREGYFADLVLVDTDDPWQVSGENMLTKCGWSPFDGQVFKSKVSHTIVSGHLAYEEGRFDEGRMGKRLTFDR